MSSNKRGRGRPIGTGLNDAPILNRIADMIVADPALRPTTAIRRCLDKPGSSNIRRLQVKWKAGAADYLAQARKRRAAALAPTPARRVNGGYTPHTARQIMEAQRKMLASLDSPTLRAAREMMNSPAMLAAQEAARRIQESPAMRAIEYMNSPTMRAMRELHDSPTMRAMREMQDSPAMRAVREASEEIAKVQRLIRGNGF